MRSQGGGAASIPWFHGVKNMQKQDSQVQDYVLYWVLYVIFCAINPKKRDKFSLFLQIMRNFAAEKKKCQEKR